MTILLDHVIVPSHNRFESAKALADLLGVPTTPTQGHFTPVFVNDSLTLDFADRERFESHHYCFRVTDDAFDAIFDRIKAAGIAYRSSPMGANDMKINTRLGGRGVYWEDADGHLWEILTVSYARPEAALTT